MSLILKGIDIPNSGQIEIIIRPHGKVLSKTRGITAEAIQIPKGHGRLIDADALETIFKEDAKCEWNQKVSPISWAYAFEDTINEIENAPTILDKEKE